jgi:ketosteroid isomerase-like protein
MRRWFVVPLALVIALPFAAAAPDDTATVKKQIDAGISKMLAAFKKHDIKGVMAIAADDYEGVDETGKKVNKAQMEKQMKQYMAETQKINSMAETVSGLKVKGNTATGKTTFNLDAVITDSQGMMGPKGKTHAMKVEEYDNVTWTKSGGKWLISKESPAGPPKMELDGKAFNPMAPAPHKPAKPK